MKRILAIPTLLLIFCGCRQPDPASAPGASLDQSWGQTSNGLRCRLALAPKQFKGSIGLTLDIQNVSDKNITLAHEPFLEISWQTWNLYTAPDTQFTAEQIAPQNATPAKFLRSIRSYGEYQSYCRDREAHGHTPRQFGSVTIPGHGTWSKGINILHPFPKPRQTWRFQIEHAAAGSPQHWRGKIVSNSLLIELHDTDQGRSLVHQ